MNRINEKAQRARELGWDGKFPVDPVLIGESLLIPGKIVGAQSDCAIRFQGLSNQQLNGDSGYAELNTSAEEPHFICAFNSEEPAVRQRFTQAHELGHVILKHVNDGNRLMRDSDFQPGSNMVEMEANQFAAELLMPAKYMEIMTRQTPDMPKLAAILGVSTTALRYRLRNLGLL